MCNLILIIFMVSFELLAEHLGILLKVPADGVWSKCMVLGVPINDINRTQERKNV